MRINILIIPWTVHTSCWIRCELDSMADNVAVDGAAAPAEPAPKSVLDQLIKVVFVFALFQFLTRKSVNQAPSEIITPDIALQRSADSRIENALKQPNQFEALIGMHSDVDIPTFPTHDKDGFSLGI